MVVTTSAGRPLAQVRHLSDGENSAAADAIAEKNDYLPFGLRREVVRSFLMPVDQVSDNTACESKVEWHFYRSPKTGKVGPSKPLKKTLDDAGIGVEIYE